MEDTSPEMKRKHLEILMAKTPGERLMMACEQTDSLHNLTEFLIAQEFPNLSLPELKAATFKRFYQGDFPKEQLEIIAESIKNFHSK